MMLRHLGIAAWVTVLFTAPLFAQFGSSGMGGNSSSMFGSSMGGSSMGGSSMGGMGGNSAFGSSMGGGGMGSMGSMGSMGMGGGGMGGMGNTGMGMTGTGNTGNRNGMTGTGMNGQNSFLGANNNPNSFLGRNAQGQQGNMNQGQNRGNRGGQQRGLDQQLQQLLNGGNGQYGGTNGTQNKGQGVHPRSKVSFEHPTLKTPVVVTSVQKRFTKLSTSHPKLKGVDMSVGDDGVVVLSGSVNSQDAARVAANLVRLEPGVKSVRNELTFPPPAAAE